MDTKRSASEVLGLNEAALVGVGAETLLQVMEPMIEKRFQNLLQQLQNCPPELGPILDIRARLLETWRMRDALRAAKNNGSKAREALMKMFEQPEK